LSHGKHGKINFLEIQLGKAEKHFGFLVPRESSRNK